MPFGFALFGGVSFNPSTDIPSLAGKVIFITGGNVGLGKETVIQLAHHNPSHIYIAARTESKALQAIKDIEAVVPDCPPITFIQCDLTSLPSVQNAAQVFARKEKRLDILLLNAGIMASPPSTTEQGYEIQFGTNHVGHALLTKLLLPTLVETAELPDSDVRVVALSSAGHALASVSKGIDFPQLKTDMKDSFTMTRYGQSKLANVLFIKELAKQYPKITAISVHPGVVNTELMRSIEDWPIVGSVAKLTKSRLLTNVKDGAKNQLWACVARRGTEAKGEVRSGEYYVPIGTDGQGSRFTKDQELAEKLWVWTEAELEGYSL